MIYVCDAIMGSGKSSAAIAMMNSNTARRYLYVTPYNDEVDRIVGACSSIGMVQPEEEARYGKSKVLHTERLVQQNRNIASTHQAFMRYRPSFLQEIAVRDYTLIVDENIDPLQKVNVTSSYVRAAAKAGFIREERPGVYTLVDKENCGDFDADLFQVMRSHDLLAIDEGRNCAYYWIMPPDFLTAFKDVYILTYLFEGQGLYTMLKMYNLPFIYIGVERDDDGFHFSRGRCDPPAYVSQLKSMIYIVDNAKLNDDGEAYYAYAKNGYKTGRVDLNATRRNLKNYFTHLHPSEADERMWSTYADYEKDLKGNGYASRFRALNLRATNAEAKSCVLAYMVNLFVPRGHTIFFHNCGVETNDGLYALSTMVQWIWRSAIRNGQPIILYMPSRRMRDLLTDWIDDLEAGRDPKTRFLQGATNDGRQ